VREKNIGLMEIEKLKREKEQMSEKIDYLEQQLEEFYINRKSESGLLLEIEHLKKDNVRLLGLLKSTDQYKDFAYLAEDTSGGVMFVKDKETNHKHQPSNKSFSRKVKDVKNCRQKDFIEYNTENNVNWVPMDAYKCANDFSRKYQFDMSDEMISELLASLNKIWRDREKKVIARTKTKYEGEVLNLRRQMTMKTGFDEFSAMKQISLLKAELREAREENTKNLVQRNRKVPQGIELVDNALKLAKNFEKKKKVMEGEIKSLNKKLDEKDKLNDEGKYERLKFNEGSLWMIGRCYNEMENMKGRIEEISEEYKARVKTGGFEENNCGWFTQMLNNIVNESVEKFRDFQYNNIKTVESLTV